MGSGNDRSINRMKMKDIKEVMRLPRFLRKFVITKELKLTMFTYKWGKCAKLVEKYLLESLIY